MGVNRYDIRYISLIVFCGILLSDQQSQKSFIIVNLSTSKLISDGEWLQLQSV